MFEPWIGNDYGQLQNELSGTRLLVLGESHYSREYPVGLPHAPLTQQTIQWYLAGHHRRFFANIAAAVSGQAQSRVGHEVHHKTWQCMAFYNYIPVIVADTARKFDEKYWAMGTEEFNSVLEQLKPDVVLVCGYRLFPRVLRRHTPGFEGDPWTFSSEVVQLGGTSMPLALRMMHPSAAFSAKKWAPKITELMKSAKDRPRAS